MNFPLAQINLAALRHNFQQVKQHAPQAKIMSVIKADAYGHGAKQIAETLKDSDAFAVARLSEALYLREHGILLPIVILEGLHTAAEFELAVEHDLSPVFHHQSQIDLLTQITLRKPLRFCWLMVDSGMHRLGIMPSQTVTALQQLESTPNIQGEVGLMSHFANADLVDDPRNQLQLNHMTALKLQTGREICLANSAAVISMADAHQDWVRPGLMLYGLSPFSDKSAEALNLQAVMQLKTRLIAIYPIAQGEQVGYGGSWSAPSQTKVGVASIGYGDGYSRLLSNQSNVLIHGRLAPLIGRVSMDTICIDLNAFDDVEIGDEVVLWGDDSLTVEALAELAQTIPYELVTVICPRVQKEFVDG